MRLARPAALVLLAAHAALSLWPALASYRNDFLNYYLPARARWEGRALDRAYEPAWTAQEARRAGLRHAGLFAPNPPPNAALLVPLAALGPAAAKAAWTAVLAACLVVSFLSLKAVLPLPPALLALAFLLPTASLSNALAYGPPYALLLMLACLSFAALARGRPLACGLLLAPAVVLKLYALALLPWFLWTRRWRAAAGMAAGTVLLALASVALLGLPVHVEYAREMLPASLTGRIIDPYSPFWQTFAGVARRLFQHEPDLNPHPAADAPAVAAALARGAPLALLAASVLLARPGSAPARLRREWAVLLLASLAASPMTATYHLVLLVLPVALLLAEEARAARVAVALGLHGFATSFLPHLFAPLAAGWWNLLACPRLVALLALWWMAAAPLLAARTLTLAAAAGLAAGATAFAQARGPAPEWTRLPAARGFLLGQPVACGGVLAWRAAQEDGLVVRAADGRRWDAAFLRCRDGRLLLGDDAGDPDADVRGGVAAAVDAAGDLVERSAPGISRVLAPGPVRHPRWSPGGEWIVYQAWRGSWDLEAVERSSGRRVRLTRDPGHEREPSWSEEGTRVLFVSDRRRGLFGGALYSAAFSPQDPP